MWGGRFQGELAADAARLNASLPFDQRLAVYDILGSLAHAQMLAKQHILQDRDAQAILSGLQVLLEEARAGTLSLREEDEDIHMNVERLLTQRIGEVGGRLHTGRSRNDQVALDMHLYVRDQLLAVAGWVLDVAEGLAMKGDVYPDAIVPGYTHLQHAQPVLWRHHLLAYSWMLLRDAQRLLEAFARSNVSPLGAGALAGSTFPLDRRFVADALGMDGIYPNSLDAVSDRDFVVEAIFANTLCLVHLSRFCEEVVLWSSSEFGFLELDDAYATGSSMMPQKKNPDLAELIRGKVGRLCGDLVALLTTLKGLPLAYNKDLQEDKEPLFDAFDTLLAVLPVLVGMVGSLQLNVERAATAVANDFSNATDLADFLTQRGMPFRQAHAIVGQLVQRALHEGKRLRDLPLSAFQAASPLFDDTLYEWLDPVHVVAQRQTEGGTAPQQVERQRVQFQEQVALLRQQLTDARQRATVKIS
ncbi:MAG: argininosuccinate lyase [Firmicutes bacterium]|nr:argininosuccinate lyase [Bacillota bacterium]